MKGLTILWLAGLIWGMGLAWPEVNDLLNAPLALALALVLAAILASYLAVGRVSWLVGRYASRPPADTPTGAHPTPPLAVSVSRPNQPARTSRAARRLGA